MAPTITLRSLLPRSPHLQHRSLHTSSPSRASILFALGALSNSRETQHFNKLSRLERVEHSPNLKLIQTSEIDQFPCPAPDAKPLQRVVAPWGSAQRYGEAAAAVEKQTSSRARWDTQALAAGRAVLADVARERSRMRRVLERVRRREARRDGVMRREREGFEEERRRMGVEMRAAGAWIVVSVATATGLAMYVFWPPREKTVRDGAELGRKLAERARDAIPLAAVSGGSVEPVVVAGAGAGVVPATDVVTGEPTVGGAETVFREEVAAVPSKGWSWKSLFWRQG